MNKLSFVQVPNVLHFYVDIKNFPNDSLLLRKFESTDDGIMTDTVFSLEILTDYRLSLESIIGKEATLHFRWFNQTIYHRGFIILVETLEWRQNYYRYRIELASLLHPLTLAQNNRVFDHESPLEIVRKMVRDLNIASIIWAPKLSNKIKTPDRLVQYHETDWDFMRRILSEQGIGFVWQHDAKLSTLVLFDEFFVLPRLQNPRLPYITLSNQVRDDESVWHWEQHYTRTGNHATAKSDCMGLTPGLGFELESHPEDEFNRGYRILAVKHQGQQSTALDNYNTEFTLAYQNEITIIPDNIPYQPLKIPAPKPNALFTGKISGDSPTIPTLNEDGSYQVRLDFDNAETQKFHKPFPMRKLEPYVSQGAGWHFPLRAGTEILTTFIDDVTSEPIVLGALPNIDSPSPVTRDNAQQYLIKTQSGHQLCLDDNTGQPQLTLATAKNLNRLVMQVNHGIIPDHTELHSEQGMLQLNAGKNLEFTTAGSQKNNIAGKHTISVEGSQHVSSIEGSLSYKSGADIHQEAGGDFSIHSDIGSIHLEAKNSIALHATDAINLATEQGQAELRAEQGSIKIHSQNVRINTTNAPINFQQANSSLSMSDGKTILKAKRITLKADKITFFSSNVMHNNVLLVQ